MTLFVLISPLSYPSKRFNPPTRARFCGHLAPLAIPIHMYTYIFRLDVKSELFSIKSVKSVTLFLTIMHYIIQLLGKLLINFNVQLITSNRANII